MMLMERIYDSLAHWGEHPVFIELFPDRPPVYCSAADFKGTIAGIKDLLIKFGIRENFIAALLLNNSTDFAAIFLALIDIGAKPIPINTAFRKLELDEIFSNAEPHAIIAESEFLDLAAPYSKTTLLLERRDGGLHDRTRDAGAARKDPADIPGDIASINYTYRGYGYPLGALVPHGQYLDGADFLEAAVKLERGERILAILPMQHIFTLIGCVFLPLLYQVTPVISYTRNPLRLFEAVREHGIDHILAVPEVYELFLKLREGAGELPRMKAFLSGGSVLPKENYARLVEEFDVDLIHGYGLTEFTPVSRNIRGSMRPGTIGTISDGVECRIGSPDENGSGEILIKTKNMVRHYYNRPAETREAFENGWFKTGDIGRIEHGSLVFEKEKKGTRKVKGNMVDLEEIKTAIASIAGVRDVRVTGRNNMLSAEIVFNKLHQIDMIQVKNYLGNMIAVSKIPQNISMV